MPDPTQPSTPPSPPKPLSMPGVLVKEKYQNIWTFEKKIQREFPKAMLPVIAYLFIPQFRELHAEKAGKIIAHETRNLLPKGEIAQSDIKDALLKAINKHAQRDPAFTEILPAGVRPQVAERLASRFEPEAEQPLLQAAVEEEQAYRQALDASMPSAEEVEAEITTRLKNQGIAAETSQAAAEQIRGRIDQEALRNETPVPEEAQRAIVQTAIDKNLEDLTPQKQEQLTAAVLETETLPRRAETVGGLSPYIRRDLFDRYKTFTRIVREEVEKDVLVSVADQTGDRKPTLLHLKEPITIADEQFIKIAVHNRTTEADSNLPANAAMPTFQYGTRLERPKDVKLNSIESFTVYDPKTKTRVYIQKDQLDLKALQKIDKRAFEKFGLLFDEKKLKSFEATYRLIKNPAGEATRRAFRPIGKVLDTVTKPVQQAIGRATAPVRKVFSKTVTAVSGAVSKVTTPVTQAVGKTVSLVTTPVKRVVNKLVTKGVQLAAKGLIKVGLGGVVKKIEQLALAGSVVGIPLLIVQELVSRGFGQSLKALKSLRESWRKAGEGGLVQGSLNTVGASVDTLGSGAGAIIGGGLGTVAGALLGALIGSAIPVIGTVLGGIVGGIAGGIFGTGAGANFGAKLRKKIQKWLAMRIALHALWKNLILPMLIKNAATVGGALIGGVVGFIIGGPIGAVIGVVIGAFIGSLVPAAVVAAKQLGFIGIYYLSQAATAANQLVFTIIPHYATTAFQSLTATGGISQAAGGIIQAAGNAVSNLFQSVTSGLAKAFNTATGWLSGTTAQAAATADAIATGILTTPSTIVLSGPLVTTGLLIVFFSFVTYTYLIAVYHVTPTEVTPYQTGPPGGSVVPCTDENDITQDLASRISAGSVNLLPPTLSPRNPPYCIIPTAIVMHWSGGWDNDQGNNATYNTLVARDLACQVATDTDDTWLMQSFYETMVEMAWCAGYWNSFSINNEMAGGCYQSGYCDRRFTDPPPPPNDPESDLAIDAMCEIIKQYDIPWCQIYGHYDVPNSGKIDPGQEYLEGYFIPRMRNECPNDPQNICP